MGRKGYLIDTNISIEYLGDVLPSKTLNMLDKILDDEFSVSVINNIELLGFSGITKHEEQVFDEFIHSAIVLGLNEDVIEQTIELRKHYRIKLPDAIIAATALQNDLILITRNTKDFDKIKSLKIIDPHQV